MKKILLIQLAVAAIVLAFTVQPVFAEDTTPPGQSHEEHHPDGADSNSMNGSGMMNNGMMGSMNMGAMQGMMHQCMGMHKDGKMCDHEAMEACQKQMGKGECKKMMKQAKVQEKTKAKSKKNTTN